MKKSVLYMVALLMPLMAVAGDITIVDNQPMTAVEGQSGWYKYVVKDLSEGDAFSVIFNNGGWAGGQTSDLYVESASTPMCFTSNGSGSAITEISCPTTEAEEAALTEGALSVYSNGGKIYGSVIGVVEIYTMSGVPMQVIDADGAFCSRQLPEGFYVVRSGSVETKILVM